MSNSNEVTRAHLKGVWALMGEAWDIYSERFWPLMTAVLVPMFLASLFSSLSIKILGTGTVVVMFASMVELLALSVGVFAALIVIVERVGVIEAYRGVPGKFVSYLWICILRGLAILGGYLLGIVPGILFKTEFLFASYIFLEERRKGMGALLRSREYVEGYWWATYGRMWGGMLVIFVLMTVAYFPTMAIARAGKGGESFATQILSTAFVPLFMAFTYAIYRNIKERKPDLPSRESAKTRVWIAASGVLGAVGAVVLAGYAVFFVKAELVAQELAVIQLNNNERMADMQDMGAALEVFSEKNRRGATCKTGVVFTSDAGTTAVDGTGWLPVDLTAEGVAPPHLERLRPKELPRDPVNVSPFIYSFACDPESGEYELNAVFDPKGVPSGEFQAKAQNDGGNNPDVYEVGSNLNLIP